MGGTSEFEHVRSEPDPIQRGRRATELITLYQQRAAELARLRKEAIEEAHRKGLNYTEIAELLGITKGRISQIKSGAPPAERAFFGVGPVAVGIPRREVGEGGTADVFDASDRAARSLVEKVLARLSLASSRFEIEPDAAEVPPGDTVVICAPGSAPVAQQLMTEDDTLKLEKVDGEWCLVEKATGRRYTSPATADPADRADIGFLGRREEDGRVIVHIAGMTSMGSHGVAHWLDSNVSGLYEPSVRSASAVVESDVEAGTSVVDSRVVAGPFVTRE
ncbi:sigma factor-like helix-turn-helix DNA-binding protein [Nocardia flavorosea]|uniref:sigma factor-like helix-turn-helix DNA-binding protein n=1 Tax=Nocardia flavorosea TaxID=53429 RepID=UPI002455BE65|nr:sigma factor-like helix-turn-helix DNA-binding protein [Nocardia flavorosea]